MIIYLEIKVELIFEENYYFLSFGFLYKVKYG